MAASNVRTSVERTLRERSDELKAGHVQEVTEIDSRMAKLQDNLATLINSRMNKKGVPAYVFRDSENSPDPFSEESRGSQAVSTPWIFLRLVINERTRLRRFAADYQMEEFGFQSKDLRIGVDKLGRKIGAPAVDQWILEEGDFNARPAQMPEIEIGHSNLQRHVDFRIQLNRAKSRLVVDVKPHFLKGPGGGKHAKSPVSDKEILRRLQKAGAETEENWERSPEELQRIMHDLEQRVEEKPPTMSIQEARKMGFDDETHRQLMELWKPFAEDIQAVRDVYREGIDFFISEVEVDLALALIEGNGGVADRLENVHPDQQVQVLQQVGEEMITRSTSNNKAAGWEDASRQGTQEVRHFLHLLDAPTAPSHTAGIGI